MEHLNQSPLDINEQRSISHISPETFPLPDRADTFARPLSEADEANLARLSKFADLQANAANQTLEALVTLENPPTAEDWAMAYRSLITWRSTISPAQFDQTNIAPRPKRLLTPINDADPNCDRIGVIGRLRASATWNEQTKTWIGGQPTPSSRIHEQAGIWAMERFAAEGNDSDRLHNIITLPDGSVCQGNSIVRGESARAIALHLKQGAITRRDNVSQFETGGDCIFTVTASQADRTRIFLAAMNQLADLATYPRDNVLTQDLAEIAYLLFQAPIMKKGSDAVIRTYLVAATAYLQGRALVLPQDIDLRAYIAGQDNFILYFTDRSSMLP